MFRSVYAAVVVLCLATSGFAQQGALVRKEASHTVLRAEGVPILETLPPIADEAASTRRTDEEVIRPHTHAADQVNANATIGAAVGREANRTVERFGQRTLNGRGEKWPAHCFANADTEGNGEDDATKQPRPCALPSPHSRRNADGLLISRQGSFPFVFNARYSSARPRHAIGRGRRWLWAGTYSAA